MEVMREAVEYAVGIFHGSIMAIQSGGAEGGGVGARTEFVVSTWERRDLSGGVPRRAARRPLEYALHLSRRDPVDVFFPFPGNRTEKGT